MSNYSTQENLYHFARVSGTITAGIFTGLTLCSPLISTPVLTPSLIPHSSRVEQFSNAHKALLRTALPIAGASGLLFCLAAWVRPGEVVLNVGKTHGVGGGVAMNVVSDRLRQVTPLTLLLPPLLLLPIPFLAYPLNRYLNHALSTSNLAVADKIAPAFNADGPAKSAFAGEQFTKDVKGWSAVWIVAGALGLSAAAIGGCGLIGWGL
ncbi:hypothetical protein CALVIDRAFT_601375 [Calocera viscosa TUFC12733]|uniref:Uncharacterized protein n=1 Tax=Calocera viscosa (strain TUFC12733) TaxID=1330018 RepID=A0A167IE45_CALVF|nr:hypothetical protein CALVIDRAFT_601375 [Calocera viscosa TUFC12733]